ncbi:trans-sulfuration enzyme family protein [Sorangium sp. So ce1097]|uniref:trans-sulfuration enzyme family protein n=1 Tax=Sorangium sp. So ce1097 TaxID=3133330 RepID=UPI003F62FE3E
MPSPETIAAQARHSIDDATGAVVPPLHTSTTYARDEGYRLPAAHEYTRDDNPTYRAPEQLLATLEGGADARLFASGMAAATAAVQALVRPGARLVASRAMYHGLRLWMTEWCQAWNVDLELVDATDPDALRAAVQRGPTSLVWIETPANPTWDVVDIAAAAEIAHAGGARLAVDSTVATPVHTRPLALGADLVMHSATKALNGHSDVLAGALAAARDDEAWQRVCRLRRTQGAVPGPFEAWLLLRGMRTLFVRVERASSTALELARRLSGHARVERVLYPGLESHPGHLVAARQMRGGFGAMLSIVVKGGAEDALRVAGRMKVFLRATSLGGVESLVEHRASVEGPGTLAPPNLLRLSIGLESVDDLWADLDEALGAR